LIWNEANSKACNECNACRCELIDEKNQNSSSLELVDRISFGNDQLNMFEAAPSIPEYLTGLEQDLKNLDIMNLTPIQALQKLQDMKTKILNV